MKTSQQNLTMSQALERAHAHMQDGRLAEAEALCRKILDAKPDAHEAWHVLGLLAWQTGQVERAIGLIEKALGFDGSRPLYLRNLGEMCRQAGRLPDAITFGRRAVALDASDTQALYNLGVALGDAGKTDEAIGIYRRATELDPKHGLAFNNLGSALEAKGDKQAAKDCYQHAVDINAQHPEAQNNLGAIQSEQGELDAARASFNAAIYARPDFIDPHFNLSTLKKYEPGDPHGDILEELAKQREKLTDDARARLCFAVGKAREDIGDHQRAFEAYQEGNRLTRSKIKYDEQRTTKTHTDIKHVFSKNFLESFKDAGDQSRAPVFIVGMPRSGSTLIEQVLSSHPDVFGAGELPDLNEVIMAACPQSFPQGLGNLDGQTFSQIGKDYVRRLQSCDASAKRITDKMPSNFYYVGMIRLMLPNAKIIHSCRGAMDICWSNYTRHFKSTMEFAYDLEELGRYHNRYKDMMDHWSSVLPEHVILDVDYENMVEDLESQARRLIDFVGLDWNDACLDFHKNPRHVQTASIAQVRQPIYKSSLNRWQHYEEQLAPLKRVLETAYE